MDGFAVVAIGASLGGVEACMQIAAGLDPASPAAWFMTLHIDGHRSTLQQLLQRDCRLPVREVTGSAPIRAGTLSLAAPDHHLLLRRGIVDASRGPRENHTRPAIDPMFRSAADAYGPQVIGVVLTGMLNDGTAGLVHIKRLGGLAVVQDPADAVCPSMPSSALAHVAVDCCAPLARLPGELELLVAGLAAAGAGEPGAGGWNVAS